MVEASSEGYAERYSAFLSYSHKDAAFARRLHRRLETYRFPRGLRRSRQDLPARLKPVFLDREELPASDDLSQAVRDALAASASLIVICSPNAIRSRWVRREVASFREQHADARVLAALVDGAGAETLAVAAARDGAEPLAADFSKTGDGDRLAFLKLVAALADVRLDHLVQRDTHRRLRRVTIAAIGAGTGMAVLGVLAVVAVQGRNAAVREQARGGSLIDFLLTDMRSRLKAVGRLDLLDALNKGALAYYQSQSLSHLSANALLERAKLLSAMGEDDERRGKLSDAKALFEEAERTTAAVLRENPRDPACLFQHAQSEYWLGDVDWQRGDVRSTQRYFEAYAALATELVRMEPHNPKFQLELGYASNNLGMFLLRVEGDANGAEPAFTTALAAQGGMLLHDPGNAEVALDEADTYGWLADVALQRHDLDGAAYDRKRALVLIDSVLRTDPRSAEAAQAKVVHELGLARIDLARGSYDSALDALERDEDDARRVAAAEPQDAGVADEVRMIRLFEAEAMLLARKPDFRARVSERVTGCAGGGTPDGKELEVFCLILRAGCGKPPAAPTHELADLITESAKRGRFSPRWGIDYQAEFDRMIRLADTKEAKDD